MIVAGAVPERTQAGHSLLRRRRRTSRCDLRGLGGHHLRTQSTDGRVDAGFPARPRRQKLHRNRPLRTRRFASRDSSDHDLHRRTSKPRSASALQAVQGFVQRVRLGCARVGYRYKFWGLLRAGILLACAKSHRGGRHQRSRRPPCYYPSG